MLYENPLELLYVDPVVVEAVGNDPERVRTLARGMYRVLARNLHSDVAAERSELLDEATEAIAEINGADSDGMMLIVEEFRSNEPEERTRDNLNAVKEVLKDEQIRRIRETRALLKCALAEKPSFTQALIEVGISPYYGTNEAYSPDYQEELSMGVTYQNPPLFVLIGQDLKGKSMRVGDQPGGFVFEDEHITVHKNGNVTVKGSGTDYLSGSQLTARLKLTPNKDWEQGGGVSILGVVHRDFVEPREEIARDSSALGLPRPPKSKPAFAGTEDLDWEDVSQPNWIKHLKPATAENMANHYVIVADKDLNQVAVLGLCRKLIP
jgi:hypothetical protein